MDKRRIFNLQRQRRKGHVRRLIRGTTERPRLSVFRSGRHISAQIIDDEAGRTLAAASTQQKEINDGL
jgi:large subunit ribosomal protein L18